MSDDDPEEEIPDAVLAVATAAQHLLIMSEALAEIHGAGAVRNGLLVAAVTFFERTLAPAGMADELRAKVDALLEDPALAAAIRWLH